MVSGNGRSFPDRFLVKLDAATLDDDMRARNIFGVKPKVFVPCGLKGQNIIFLVVSADQNAHAVGKRVAVRGRLVFLFLEAACLSASADIARLDQLCANAFDFSYIIGIFKERKHGFQILDFGFVFVELNLLFFDCRL